ncbi:hypothetical protein PQY04_002907 [Salmonella enterica]|uniref:Uncharacterized protein n=1 Tax=Salmonella enterica TaxID=28901 RepID=A0ACC5L2J8_SALER|nr:hypothetical protein [Salmonella enterica]EHQ7005128.1 hypothetical protein [Salmonella enterica subsp. houtenae serovar 50:z4,z23:-]EKR1447132.1 hypothetical protein [Salmonella enterica subsp. houtenae serovar 48:z4,z32:-]VUD22413.1 oxidoreductase [Salmonella sp. NCTC 7297]HBC0146258.1 hypothetical protein [Salmonella enterica subsp. houtenae]HCZ1710844.1 hypothetical protein [Salmonella enterica subsp. enterica serovar Montevideo str. 0269]
MHPMVDKAAQGRNVTAALEIALSVEKLTLPDNAWAAPKGETALDIV